MALLHRMAGNGPNLIWEANSFPSFIGWIYWFSFSSTLVLVAFLIWSAIQTRGKTDIAGYASAVILTILAAPIAWEHHYGAILPFFMPLLALALMRHEWIQSCFLLGLAWILIANYLPALSRFADGSFNFIQSYVFFGGLVFLYLSVQLNGPLGRSGSQQETAQLIKAAPDA